MKIAFYAPLKSPEHPKPSGDRQMARALIKALIHAGHEVQVISHLRGFSKTPHMVAFIDQFTDESKTVIKQLKEWQPDLWFSYHPYYKAPDFLALKVCDALGLNLVTVEASLAVKRDGDEWATSQRIVRETLQHSRKNFYFTERDKDGLLNEVDEDTLVYLPPFIDTPSLAPITGRKGQNRTMRFVTMGMMRGGVKSQSYQFLARALAAIKHDNWSLTIIGDGQDRANVEAMFNPFSKNQISWAGEIAPDKVAALLSQGDVFLWPGFGEAYGLAYLEAQFCTLPVVALNTHGVPWVVKDGETGVLIAREDVAAFAAAIDLLCEDTDLRLKLGKQARQFVTDERSLESASDLINRHIRHFK